MSDAPEAADEPQTDEEILMIEADTKFNEETAKLDELYHHMASKEDMEVDHKKASDIFYRAMKQARILGEMKSRFLAGMCEELKVPMKAILGFADKLKNSMGLDENDKGYIEAISDSGKTLLAYIEDVWGVSEIKPKEITLEERPFNFKDLANGMIEMLKFSYGDREINFDCSYDRLLAEYFIGDTTRIRQVILNLATNAVKKLQKGEITLIIERGENRGDELLGYREIGYPSASDLRVINIVVNYGGLVVENEKETVVEKRCESRCSGGR